MDVLSQNRQTDREPFAAGRFYSAVRESLRNDLAQLFAGAVRPGETADIVRALISPHAGYVFSGKTAASAFASIPADKKYHNIFLIGSSHVMAFEGASVYHSGDFVTPLGKIKVNTRLAEELRKDHPVFRFPETAHAKEHSLEVLVPFIQYHFTEQPQIVPIIIGTNDREAIKKIAGALKPWFTAENLFIISSDFSHYPSYKEAIEVDNITADAILSKSPDKFLRAITSNSGKGISNLATSMCGMTSGLMLLYLINNDPGLVFRKISYCNSGDSPFGNKNEVVGYHAIVLEEKPATMINKSQGASGAVFTEREEVQLFSIARTSISMMLNEKRRQVLNPEKMHPGLKNNLGAFVTLKLNGNLRGCIGCFVSPDPLYEVVNQMAFASAFSDSRFLPLTAEEFDRVKLEISIIGPLKRISNISEIELGRHGIYIKKELKSGTMLPQVAVENKWSVEDFLGHTSRDKAGLGWDGWKDAELYIYETVVLEEK